MKPRKELTNRAKRDNIPDEELGKYPDAFVTIWTGRYKCPKCGAILDNATIPDMRLYDPNKYDYLKEEEK